MRKMKLDLARLEVESFDVVVRQPVARGTVRAHGTGDPETIFLPDTSDAGTCGAVTCQNTCNDSSICGTLLTCGIDSCVWCSGSFSCTCPQPTELPTCPSTCAFPGSLCA